MPHRAARPGGRPADHGRCALRHGPRAGRITNSGQAGGQVAREATRRGVLAAVAALPLAAAGCKGIGALGTPPRPLPDVAVLREAIAAETLMIARYTAVLTAAPALAGSLRPILGQHQAHLARLKARLVDPRAGSGQPPPPPHPRVPVTPAAARAYLHDAEQAAAQAMMGKLPAASPSLAQLLASIAASEASHALLLGPHRRTG
jgi:hypothetical protein